MKQLRVVTSIIFGISLVVFMGSGLFVLFGYDMMESRIKAEAMKVEPDAYNHSDVIKSKLYYPGSEVFVDFKRSGIEGYRRVENIQVKPKKVQLADGKTIDWKPCQIILREHHYSLRRWKQFFDLNLAYKRLGERGIIRVKLPFMNQLAHQTVRFDISATYILPGQGSEDKRVALSYEDLFVTVSSKEFYQEVNPGYIGNFKRKFVAERALIFSGILSGLTIIGLLVIRPGKK